MKTWEIIKKRWQPEPSPRPAPQGIDYKFARDDILDLIEEIERLQEQLHEAKKIIKIVDKIITDEVLYDDDEGDCIFCGAEAYEDGYHHESGCFTNRLETALQLYKARIKA